MRREDPDLKRYRDLMTPPDHFDEGFTWTAFAGALFVGLLIMPGSLYMGLLAGGGVGQAANWVTMILFIEVAKRAHKSINRAEMFILFYMAATVVSSPFGGLLWNQYFVQSKAVIGQGMADMFPRWYAPTDPVVLASRNFFQVAWLPAIGLVLFQLLISRLDNNIIGYGLFKLASDVERLPFPMAPIGAQGIMALAEDLEENTGKKPGWRWRVFSIGGAIGMLFGFLYMGLPTITKALFNRPIQMFPIPFVDWTGRTQNILPAVATGLSFDLGALVLGTVLPFWAMIGSFAGLVITFIVNPILYHAHVLHSWIPGDSTVETTFKNTVDFYFSYGLGISLAIALIGFLTTWRGFRETRRRKSEGQQVITIPKDRGDIPFPVVGLVYLCSVICYITVSGYLIGWHKGVMIVLVILAFIYTPLVSYVTARLEGTVGQALAIPFVREAAIILSGYKGLAVWFLPFPMNDYGVHTVFYRQAELTGTRFTSKWKAEALVVPFIIVCSITFAQLIWSMDPIPSSSYPFAEMMWPLKAKTDVLMYSSTAGGYSQFREAFRPVVIGIGLVSGLSIFGILTWLQAPTLLMYGMVQGLNQMIPHTLVLQFLGALLARFYFERRMGFKQWRQYAPVLSAGYFCGAGLTTMLCIGIMFLSKSIIKLPY